jgi:TolB-like protein
MAVLPFDNLSLQPEDAFFAAGIHEEILNQLAKIKDLSVIARTTMLGYAETDKSIPQIASELNVGTVMEGSVRYAGDRVRITAQLIDAQSGAHLWSEAFEEDLEDVFEIQLRIASRIADTLDAEFSVVERERMAVRPTEDAEAYTHYLRAVSSFGNFAMIGPMHEALDEAIAADPAFASALAFKSWLHTIEAIAGPLFVGPGFNIDDQRRSIDLAQGYARRTLELDDRQAQAHLALAWARMLNRNWKAAFERFDRAYSLNPNSYFAVNNAAWTSLYRDDVELAIELVERSVELNPADFANQNNASELFYIAERWEDARRQAELVTKLAPDAAYGFASLALANARLGDAAGVRASAAMAEARNPNLHEYAKIAQAHSLIGDSGQAKRIFDAASAGDESVTRNPVFHYEMRMAIKDWEGAVSYAEKALLEGFHGYIIPNLHFRPGHPDFDPIRSHPKFEELVRMASTTVGRWGASG